VLQHIYISIRPLCNQQKRTWSVRAAATAYFWLSATPTSTTGLGRSLACSVAITPAVHIKPAAQEEHRLVDSKTL